MGSYLPYTLSDNEAKIWNGKTPEEAMFEALRKKKERPDPQARYCPICRFEGGEEIRVVFIDGVLTCPNCGYVPVLTKGEKLSPPLFTEGTIVSGNTFSSEQGTGVKRFKLSELARNKDVRNKINRRSTMDAVHEVNQINPFEPDLDFM